MKIELKHVFFTRPEVSCMQKGIEQEAENFKIYTNLLR